jgi:hypothetical protein
MHHGLYHGSKTFMQCTFVHVQDQSLAAVQGILGCSRDTARKLLTYFQWDKEALFGMLHPTLCHSTQVLYVQTT